MSAEAQADREIVTVRVVDAPREAVWRAWTDAEHLARWRGPSGFVNTFDAFEPRPGGRFRMAMRGPNGEDFPFTGTYREVAPPDRLVWMSEFATGPAEQMTTVVTFADRGGKTALHVRQTFHVVMPEMAGAIAGANQGWGMTLDQLAAHVATA